MKHYRELISLESKVVELETFKSILSVISNGIENSSKEELETAFYFVNETLNNITDELYERFETLFDSVRNESLAKDEFQFYNEEAAEELSRIVNEWVVHSQS